MSKINIRLDSELVEKVKIIAKKKFSIRNINSSAEATREVLIEFVKKNQKYITTQKSIETISKEPL